MWHLVVVDMQHDFLRRLERSARNALVANTNRLVAAFQARELAVLVVVTEHEPDGSDSLPAARREGRIEAVRGTAGARLDSRLALGQPFERIVKAKYSAFYDTTLCETTADYAGPMVLAGVHTHACIRTTAVDAVQRDREVVIARDCVASYDSEWHASSLRYLGERIGEALTIPEILTCLGPRRSRWV